MSSKYLKPFLPIIMTFCSIDPETGSISEVVSIEADKDNPMRFEKKIRASHGLSRLINHEYQTLQLIHKILPDIKVVKPRDYHDSEQQTYRIVTLDASVDVFRWYHLRAYIEINTIF